MPQREKPLKPNGLSPNNLTDYIVTNDGKVWSNIKNRYLRGGTIGSKTRRYKAVYLKDNNGNQKWYSIHRLVALVYVPNPDNKPDVDHIDNDPLNNHYTNLQWVTHAENLALSYSRDGRTNQRGEDHWRYGMPVSEETRKKMGAKKQGENHPKFKGYYYYQDQVYTSILAIVRDLNTYYKNVQRMIKAGQIVFKPMLGNPAISSTQSNTSS